MTMMKSISIPVLSMCEITYDEFLSKLGRVIPPTRPKYNMFDLVYMKGLKDIPGIVVGVTHAESGWRYNIAHFRGYDGATEINVSWSEKDIRGEPKK